MNVLLTLLAALFASLAVYGLYDYLNQRKTAARYQYDRQEAYKKHQANGPGMTHYEGDGCEK